MDCRATLVQFYILLLQKIQRLEERDIFVTQGDLMNLWFMLSKQKSKRSTETDAANATSKTQQGLSGRLATDDNTNNVGLNSVADMIQDSGSGERFTCVSH